MSKFPVDAPLARVIRTLEALSFQLVRRGNHIAMVRDNPDRTTPLTMPNHRTIKASTLRTILSHVGIARVSTLDGAVSVSTASFAGVHLSSARDDVKGALPCGVRQGREPVYVTWSGDHQLVAIEFLPEDLQPGRAHPSAVEIAGAAEVRDHASLRRFYERIGEGRPAGAGVEVETAAVQKIGTTVLHELVAAGDRR